MDYDHINKEIQKRLNANKPVTKEPEIVDPGAENICISCE